MKQHVFVFVFLITTGALFVSACAPQAELTVFAATPEPTSAPAQTAVMKEPGPAPSATASQASATPAPGQAPAPSEIGAPIRAAEFAGVDYPNAPDNLEAMLDSYLAAVKPQDGEPIVLILPHASFQDVGQTLAAAFKQVEGLAYERVVVVAADQQDPAPPALSLWAQGGLETPLGVIPVDDAFARALMRIQPAIIAETADFSGEQSIESPLPFLQRTCPACRIVPLLIDPTDEDAARVLGSALIDAAGELGGRTLYVFVSNLSANLDEERALTVDNETLAAIETLDLQAFRDQMKKTDRKNNPSGERVVDAGAAILAAMEVAAELGADQATVLHYSNTANSPDGDADQVAGYGSIMFWDYEPPELNTAQRSELLALARKSIQSYMETGEQPRFVLDDPAYQRKSGVFITITKNRTLRGCIGHIRSEGTILSGVQEMAVAAAMADPRFLRMTPGELEISKIEISVLSPLRQVRNIDEIEIGKHGLYLKYKGRQGVLLPQVAVEQEWSRYSFLDNLCAKNGLPTTCWKNNPNLFTFSALVFAEE